MRFMYKVLFLAVLTSCCIGFIAHSASAERKYLFQWDEGEGTNMPGWTWHDDVAYGKSGWLMDSDGPHGGGKQFGWGPGPRSFELGGYGSNNLAKITTKDRSPSTSTGGALKVYEHPDTLDTASHLITWWLWYDGMPLSERGITDSTTDRWSFYIKLDGIKPLEGAIAHRESPGTMFHVGTYLCDYAPPGVRGCPKEGPGNQHYYHYLLFSPGAWIHVELDQHPQHLRGSFVSGYNPSILRGYEGMNYFEHLHQWYMDIPYAQQQETSYLLDEMYFYSTKDPQESAEPNQNNESVTSVWVGYWPNTDKWKIFWNDMSFETASGHGLNDTTSSTFEIRWSTSPITNSNYNQAELVNPEWFSGPEHTSHTNGIRRWDSWATYTWTQFELPDAVENSVSKIYFAIKDVSVAGGNAGTKWPYNRTDGRNPASPYIRAIDYYLPAGGATNRRLQITNISIE